MRYREISHEHKVSEIFCHISQLTSVSILIGHSHSYIFPSDNDFATLQLPSGLDQSMAKVSQLSNSQLFR